MNHQIKIKAAVLVFLLIPVTGAYHYAKHIDGGEGSRDVSALGCDEAAVVLSQSSGHGFMPAEIASAYDELDAVGDGDLDRALAVVETHMLQEMNLLNENFAGTQFGSKQINTPRDYRPAIIWLTVLGSFLGLFPLFYVCNKLNETGFKNRQRHVNTRAQVALQMSIARHNSHIS